MESTEFYLNPFLQNFRVITIMKSSLLKQEHKRKKFTLKYICKIFREIDWKYNLVPRPPQLFSRNFWDECILPFFVILILLTILHFAQKFCQINQKLFSTYLWFHVKIERSKKCKNFVISTYLLKNPTLHWFDEKRKHVTIIVEIQLRWFHVQGKMWVNFS